MKANALLFGLAAASFVASTAVARPIDAGDYARAEAMLPQNLSKIILNTSIDPVWVGPGDRFIYRWDLPGGKVDYIAVDPASGKRTEAFDRLALVHSLGRLVGAEIEPDRLELNDLSAAPGRPGDIVFSWRDRGGFECVLATAVCQTLPAPKTDPLAIRSPDGKREIFARQDNLWVRDTTSGQERQLTHDGEPHFAYGKIPNSGLLAVLIAVTGKRSAPFGVAWSPDSKRIFVVREDERKVPDYTFLQWLPPGSRRPRPITIRTALSGEADKPADEASLIDVDSGVVRKLVTSNSAVNTVPWWSPDGLRLLVLEQGDNTREERMLEVNAATGALRTVVEETNTTFLQTGPLEYDEPSIRFLPATNELIWFSQRDGWGRLYLIDVATGRLKAQITNGPWTI